jgi:hypothetical protein
MRAAVGGFASGFAPLISPCILKWYVDEWDSSITDELQQQLVLGGVK